MCAQVVLDLRAEGDSRLEKLKVRGQSLLQRHSERGGRDLQDVLCILRDAECQWDSVLQSAVKQYRYSIQYMSTGHGSHVIIVQYICVCVFKYMAKFYANKIMLCVGLVFICF